MATNNTTAVSDDKTHAREILADMLLSEIETYSAEKDWLLEYDRHGGHVRVILDLSHERISDQSRQDAMEQLIAQIQTDLDSRGPLSRLTTKLVYGETDEIQIKSDGHVVKGDQAIVPLHIPIPEYDYSPRSSIIEDIIR